MTNSLRDPQTERRPAHKLSWNQAALMFRRTRRVMPEKETELTLVEPAESRDAEVAKGAANETVVDADGTATPTSGDAAVSRVEYDQLKTERDQLLDRLAR